VSAAFFIEKLTGTEDDLFINLDGVKIWPNDGKKHGYIKTGKELELNILLSENWTNSQTLALYDHDMISNHDKILELTLDPVHNLWGTTFTLTIENDGCYSLLFRLS
jgi:hypothetical protein